MHSEAKIETRRTGCTQACRKLVLDIETAALEPDDEQGALNAMTGRVVCIGMLIEQSDGITEITLAGENEQEIIRSFWAAVKPGDVIVGRNVIDFDLRFLQQRSWILGIKPSRSFDVRRYYTKDVIDTLQLWTNWTGNKKGVTLDALGSVLGCGRKTGDGANVALWWAAGDIESIKKYCLDDVRLAYRVYRRLTYQEPTANRVGSRTVAQGFGD
jgi:3'-5' exonuclease